MYVMLSLTVLASAVLGLNPGTLPQIRIKRPVVVVYPLEVSRVRVDAKAVLALGQYLADKLAATRSCRIIPRSRLKKALRKQRRPAFRRCRSQECQVHVARRLGATRVLAAKIVRIGSFCIVTASLHGVAKRSKTVVVTAKGGCGEDALLESVEEVVVKIGRVLSPDLWPYGRKARAR